MSTAHILYYSGTGNTYRALGIVAEALRSRGYEPAWHELAKGRPPFVGAGSAPASGDLVLIGFPALGFSSPEPVLRALRGLPRLAGVQAAVLCVCGGSAIRGKILRGWAGAAVPEIERLLKRKGMTILASAEASYPENWRQVSRPAHGELRDALVSMGDADAHAFAASLTRALDGGPPERLRRSPLALILISPVPPLFRSLARKCLARLFTADAACTGCGLCARSCPAKAIRMKGGRPSWGLACSACNRCINACPEGAIQTSNLRLGFFVLVNAAAGVLGFRAGGRLIAALGAALGLRLPGLLSALLGFTLYCGLTLVQLGPLDALLRLLERHPALKPAFYRSFTQQFPRYLAPGFEASLRGKGSPPAPTP
jgi:ferredoxin